MMKRTMTLLAVAVVVAGAFPASARTIQKKNVTFHAPVPCLALCAHWLQEANTDADGDGKDEIYYNPCKAPFPEGSFADRVVKAPTGATHLLVKTYPQVDWDFYICSKPKTGNNGKVLAVGANPANSACDSWVGDDNPVPVGCLETAQISVKPGVSYVLRAYNWGDPADLRATYWFKKY